MAIPLPAKGHEWRPRHLPRLCKICSRIPNPVTFWAIRFMNI